MHTIGRGMFGFCKFIIAKSNACNIEMRPGLMTIGKIFKEFCSRNRSGNWLSAVIFDIGNLAFNIRR